MGVCLSVCVRVCVFECLPMSRSVVHAVCVCVCVGAGAGEGPEQAACSWMKSVKCAQGEGALAWPANLGVLVIGT